MKEFFCVIEITDKEVVKEIKESLKKPIELLNKAKRG